MMAAANDAGDSRLEREARRLAQELADKTVQAAVARALREREQSEVIQELHAGFERVETKLDKHIGDDTHLQPGQGRLLAAMIVSAEGKGVIARVARQGFAQVMAVLGLISLLVAIGVGIVELQTISKSLPAPSNNPAPPSAPARTP